MTSLYDRFLNNRIRPILIALGFEKTLKHTLRYLDCLGNSITVNLATYSIKVKRFKPQMLSNRTREKRRMNVLIDEHVKAFNNLVKITKLVIANYMNTSGFLLNNKVLSNVITNGVSYFFDNKFDYPYEIHYNAIADREIQHLSIALAQNSPKATIKNARKAIKACKDMFKQYENATFKPKILINTKEYDVLNLGYNPSIKAKSKLRADFKCYAINYVEKDCKNQAEDC